MFWISTRVSRRAWLAPEEELVCSVQDTPWGWMGAVASPFDAWLVLRSLKTLGIRMDRHCSNAARIAALRPRLAPAVGDQRYWKLGTAAGRLPGWATFRPPSPRRWSRCRQRGSVRTRPACS